ncbi:MAG: patatin-like phospholipase family protein, partial [Chloroflexi bacterium]|nr:patatin-like phospholipase family protein [Chloroflexota bacterium]
MRPPPPTPRIGLALGGGAVRGLAHIGVLSILERERIPIDCVSGVSVGAIVGAAYCAGLPIEDMRKLAATSSWRRLASRSRSRWGLVSFDRLERLLVMMLGDLDFADLDLPLAVVTMDVDTGQRVVLCQGQVAPAVRASSSVPGFVTPVQIGGRLLGDGGIVDNLPAGAAREVGATFVIGVDLFQPVYNRAWGPFGPGLAAIETLVQRAGGGVDTADCLITPRLAGQTYLRFSRAQELIAAGEAAAEAALP